MVRCVGMVKMTNAACLHSNNSAYGEYVALGDFYQGLYVLHQIQGVVADIAEAVPWICGRSLGANLEEVKTHSGANTYH